MIYFIMLNYKILHKKNKNRRIPHFKHYTFFKRFYQKNHNRLILLLENLHQSVKNIMIKSILMMLQILSTYSFI